MNTKQTATGTDNKGKRQKNRKRVMFSNHETDCDSGQYFGSFKSLLYNYLPPFLYRHYGNSFSQVEKIAIPRKLMERGTVENWELHAFVDALEHKYAAGLHLRNTTQQSYQTNLLFRKNLLALLKGMSIPRLELLPLLINVRAILYVERELKLPIVRRIVWCDSKCVLYWLETSKISFVFVMNWLKEIKQAKGIKIHYVPSKDNAADLAIYPNTLFYPQF